MKLSEAWIMYKSDKQLEGYSPYTIKGYGLQHDLFVRHEGDLEINDVTYEMIKRYLAKDIDRLRPSSISFRMKYFKSLFRWAIDEGYASVNPARKLKEPKDTKRIPKSMNEETIERLRIGCKTPLEKALTDLLYDTAARISEVFRMNINHIDWENKSIIVLGKGSRERDVYFSTSCKIWLQKYLETRNDDNTALFVTERRYKELDNQPRRMSTYQIRWVIKRIARNANLNNIYPHRYRHSRAQNLYSNGCELEVIRSYLGHHSVDITKIYADMTGERRREIINKFS